MLEALGVAESHLKWRAGRWEEVGGALLPRRDDGGGDVVLGLFGESRTTRRKLRGNG